MGAIAAAVVGAGMLTGGTWMAANSAGRRKKNLQRIAETPGIDMGEAAGDAISAVKQNQQGAQDIVARENQFNTSQRVSMLEQMVPGFSGMQKQRTQMASDLMAGNLPPAVKNAIFRLSAAKSFSGWGGGGQAGENLALRDIGVGTLEAMQGGANLFQSILASSQPGQQGSALGLIGLNGASGVDVRSRERAMRMAAMTTAVGAPGKTDVWANMLSQTGSSVLGGAMGSMGGGGGGMGGGGGSAYGYSAGGGGGSAPTWAPM